MTHVSQYPVNLVLDGRRCLVVGGGAIAVRKVEGLLACGAEVTVVAPRVDARVRDMAGVTVEEREYRPGEVAGYRLAIAATDSAEANAAVFHDGEEAGVWVNGADDPANCSFTLPSILRRGPLMVTVSTGGRSPALSRWLRQRLETEIGPEFEVLLDLMASERDLLKAEGRSTEGPGWQKALDSDMLGLIRTGDLTSARTSSGMSLVVVGLSHRTVPLEILERMTVPAEHLPKALGDLVSRDFVSEAVILSTCHRTEIYVVAERFHGGVQDIRHFLTGLAFLPPEDFSDHLFTYHDESAAAHLFAVAAGLDSVVLGESQVLGQVRTAWERAREEGVAGSRLSGLFRHALEVGKRARSETAIGRGVTSLSQAAVAMATDRLGTLEGRKLVLLGAGEMGEGMADDLAAQNGDGPEVVVASRTRHRAVRVAEKVGAEVVDLDELPAALAGADVLLSSTGSPTVVLRASEVAGVMAGRPSQPLLIVDMGMPHDVDPEVRSLPGVTLLDLADLRAFVEAGLDERRKEVGRVKEIVEDEVGRFQDAVAERQAAPLVTALRDRAEDLRLAELARYRSRLEGLDARQQEAVTALTRSLLGKLLHEPTVRLKESAGSARGERLAEAIQELFDL